MLSKKIGANAYRFLILLGYFALAFGLPFNKVVLSIATLWLVLFTLLEADFKTYGTRIKQEKASWFLIALFGFQLLSFFWSDNLSFAGADLNAKIPLLLIPLVFCVQNPLTKKETTLLFVTFLSSVFFFSIYNWTAFAWNWGNRTYDDIRGMSLFISHIRFALMVSFSAIIALYFALFSTFNYVVRIGFVVIFIWFSFYTYYSEVLSGLLTWAGALVFCSIFFAFKQRKKWLTLATTSVILFFIGVFSIVIYFLIQPQPLKIDLKNLPMNTALGNPYYHDYTSVDLQENGNPIYCFVQTDELRDAWNKRSTYNLDSIDQKGQLIHGTILRYMTSKGLTKDAAGVAKLTKEDIANIERGIPSVLNLKGGLENRIRSLKAEISNPTDPNGSSILERLEYWETGFSIWKKNLLIGTGVGDLNDAFQTEYRLNNSKLKPENRLRTHNQFLTYGISLGIVGLFIFIAFLFQFIKPYFNNNQTTFSLLALSFWSIAVLSFLVEDTLETQMGVTFFAFFVGLFWAHQKQKSTD
jgi:hypothetical protein